MLSNQTRNDMTMNNEEEKETPKADADLTNTLDSIERMLSLSPNENVLKNLLDVVKSNEGVSENPDQISRLDKLKVKITAKLGGGISENASCGATSSCCIATVAQPMMKNKKKNKVKPIRRKMLGIDALSFLECVNQDIPTSIEIRGTTFKTHYVGKHPVLMTNECVVPVIGKENIGKFIKRFYLTGNDFEVCESVISPVDFLIMNSKVICEADAKFDDKKAQNEKDDPQIDANLRNQVGRQTIATVDRKKSNDMNNTLTDTGDNDNLKTNQELVGIDDSDPTQKKYVIKDPQTGKISVKRQSEVAIQNEAVKYYKKPLLEANRKPREMKMFHRRGEGEAGPLPSIRHFNSDIHTGDNNEVVFDIFWHDETNRKIEAYKHAMRILKEWLGLKGEDLEEALRFLKIEPPIGRDKDGNDVVLKGWDVSIKSVEELSVDELIAFHNSLNESDLEEV